jgi:hypothetical protein
MENQTKTVPNRVSAPENSAFSRSARTAAEVRALAERVGVSAVARALQELQPVDA